MFERRMRISSYKPGRFAASILRLISGKVAPEI